jgi:hypothetical protein
MQEPTAPPSARAESVQPTADARASDDAENASQGNAPTSNTRTAASLTSTPVAIFPVAALALVVAGFALRVVMKIYARRHQRVAVDHHDFDWLDEQHEHELPDDQFVHQQDGLSDISSISATTDFGPRRPSWVDVTRPEHAAGILPLGCQTKSSKREHLRMGVDPPKTGGIGDRLQHELREDPQQQGSVGEGDEFIDNLPSSLTSDYRSGPPPKADDRWANNRLRKNAGSSDEIRGHKEALERLRRDLHRLLDSPKIA